MSEEVSVKYLDIDSTNRNRNNYPNPYDFVVPYSFPNKGSTSLGFFDAILDSSPYTGSPTLQPGQLVTGLSFMNLLTNAIDITLDSQETSIDNFYINSTLQIGTEFRSIKSFNGLTKVCTVSQPFFSIPPPGTIYYIRKVQTYFNSNIAIYSYDQLSNTTDQISLLTASPSPLKDFYKGSYIRFTNGSHVGETSLITKYDPFSETTSWQQSVNGGMNTFIGTTADEGFSFKNTTSGVLSSLILNISSFGSRTINIYVREGSSINGNLLISESFVLPDSSRVDFPFDFTNQIPVSSGSFYTILLQDVTGNDNGYINLFGITPGVGLITFNLNVYPKVSISISKTPTQCWIQPTNFGETNYISTSSVDNFEFVPTTSSILKTIEITIISFETVSSGRTLSMTILDQSSSIIYQDNFQIMNTPQSPTSTTLSLNSPVNVTIGNIFTLVLQDTTPGGYSTGFINMFGIIPTVGYVTSSSVYPQINFLSSGGFVKEAELNGLSGFSQSYLQGSSVSLSRDGNTLAVGNPGFDYGAVGSPNTSGAVLLYIKSGGVWSLQTQLIGDGVIGPFSNQGTSVSLSDDGNTLAVGGPTDNFDSDTNVGIGAVWIFIRTNGNWSQQAKLVGTTNTTNQSQGMSVSLSSDGNTLAFLPNCNYSNNAWVFNRNNGNWSQTQNFQGVSAFSISLSGDGLTMAFVGYGIFIWKLNGSWDVENRIDLNGVSSSISDDGNVLVFGYNIDNNSNGVCYVVNRVNGSWGGPIQIDRFYSVTNFGSSVSISGDGTEFVVGATYLDPLTGSTVGSSVVFLNKSGVWTAQQNLIGNQSVETTDRWISVAISKDKSTLSNGFPQNNSHIGSTWVYNYIGTPQSLFSQPSNPVKSSVISTVSEQGFEFIPTTTGKLKDLTLTLTSFESLQPGRTMNIKVLNQFGLIGSTVYSGSVVIPNKIKNSYVIPINSGNLSTGNIYTLVLEDTTSGGTSNGSLYIYGIDSNSSFQTLNISTYPQLTITSSPTITSYNQLSNPTISDIVSTTSNQGFLFSPIFTGNIIKIILSLTSFDITGFRTLSISILNGSGLTGSVLYNTLAVIPNILTRTAYPIKILSSESLTLNQNYTISITDVSSSGTSTGDITLYGMSPSDPFISYNISVYPQIIIKIPSFVLTIYPPKLLSGFNNDPPTFSSSSKMLVAPEPDTIEFNSQAHENATTLFYNGLNVLNAHYYKVGLKYLIIPNQILDVGRGGKLDNYPYVYVQIYNDGNRGSLNVMSSNNPNATFAVFKCPIDKNLYNRPTSFFTLKVATKDQIVKFRPDQNIRLTITLPDGTIIQNSLSDNLSPLFPNPLLQVNALFTLLPIDKYDHIPT